MTRLSGRIAVALALAGCAAEKQSWRETPEVYVEVLPAKAILAVDGREIGPGSHSVPLPENRAYTIKVTAPGFATAEASHPYQHLAGARIGIGLVPEGFGSGRPFDVDDASALCSAASALAKKTRYAEAAEYAERARDIDKKDPRARRVLGGVYAKLNRRADAVREYSIFVEIAPEGPEVDAAKKYISAARGDVEVKPAVPDP
jgi:tetratricopeptide (TPR) repeat protein